MAREERKVKSAFIRGNAGRDRTETELEKAKQQAEQRKNAVRMPFRFRVPVGETRQVIVLDEQPDFFMYEHALKDEHGNYNRLFTGCIKEFDNCPVCQATGKDSSYYAMFLSVIDLTPFTTKKGEEVEFSRKLLVVKPAQQKKFLRFFNKEGTLRGALFDMTRDGDRDSAIGNDIEFVEFVPEDELSEYTRSWKDNDGKKHTEDCSVPFVYEDIFEEPTAESLRAMVGGGPNPGSRESDEAALGAKSGRRARKAKDEDDWEDEEDTRKFSKEEEEEDEPAPRTRRTRKPVDDEDDTPPFDADKPSRAARTARPSGRSAATAARRSRHEEPEADDDAGEEEEQGSSRARRLAMRGRR